MKNNSKEITSLTGLRGITALYIVLGHIFQNYWKSVGFYKASSTRMVDKFVMNFINHIDLSVCIFFALSAYVFALSNASNFYNGVNQENYKSYLIRRFARIYPIYLVNVSIFYILFRHDFSLWDIPINFFLVQTLIPNSTINPVSWSLSTEWLTYLVLPFLLTFLSRKPKQSIYVYLILGFITNAFILVFPQYFFFDLFKCLSFYFLGLATFNIIQEFPTLKRKTNNYAFVILLVFLGLLFVEKSTFAYTLLIPLLLVSLLSDNIVSRILKSKVAYFLGLISYSLYLNHWLIYRVLSAVCSKYMLSVEQGRLVFIGGVLLSILISYITYKNIELPLGSKIRSILEKKRI